jgi:hypothetical protein
LRNGTTKRARVGALIRSTADHNFYAVESEPRATEHVGDLNGIVALFDEARRHLKYPAITLDGFRVNVAGQSAREPGSLTVTSIEKTDNRRAYFGRVTKARRLGARAWCACRDRRQASRVRLRSCRPLPHLIVSVRKEMIEILDPNEAQTRIFHIGHDVERYGQSSCKDQHVYPTAPCARRHPEAGEQ